MMDIFIRHKFKKIINRYPDHYRINDLRLTEELKLGAGKNLECPINLNMEIACWKILFLPGYRKQHFIPAAQELIRGIIAKVTEGTHRLNA